jgi:hypothetical protein
VLRKVFGHKREEVTEEWSRLHNEELCDLTKYYPGNQIKKNEIGGARGTYGLQERCIQFFGGEA